MTEAALPVELLEKEEPGFWPWVIAAVALLAMLISLVRQVGTIPDSLQSQAVQQIKSLPVGRVTIETSGRDMTVSGNISPDVDREAIFSRLTSIEGVRVVYDELNVINPEAQLLAQKEKWQELLKQIDVSTVAFEPSSATIARGSETPLNVLASLLKQAPDLRIRVTGHTDNTGRASENLGLSRSRARSVTAYLSDRGVASEQLIAQGYGDTQPIADNETEAGRARNRRIEINYVD